MKRWLAMLYSVAVYVCFFGVFLYLIGFMGNMVVPQTIDGEVIEINTLWAMVVDSALILLFGLQHSIMARESFKRWWTKIIPPPVERSTYVLIASLLLMLLMWQWRPIGGTVWQIENRIAWALIWALFWVGWAVVFVSTWLINHFELFGLQQSYAYWRQRPLTPPKFQTPFLYKWVRHPMQLGILIAFWSTPQMTRGHLLFATGMTLYILIGLYFEERDLLKRFGSKYRSYRRVTAMLIPGLRDRSSQASTGQQLRGRI